MKSQKFVQNTLRIVLLPTHRIENSAIQPADIHIEDNNFIIVVGVHGDQVLVKLSMYGSVEKKPIAA